MTKYFVLLLFPILLLVSSCGDDDDPVIENQEELITQFIYRLEPRDSGATVTLAYNDPDGDGSIPAVLDVSGSLMANRVYNGSITLSNLSDPANPEDITEEVREEGVDHQFFFQPSAGLNITVAYDDVDDNSKPIGLVTTLTTGTFSSGNITILLRHEPNKDAAGISISDPSGAGGTSDVDVTFPVSIGN